MNGNIANDVCHDVAKALVPFVRAKVVDEYGLDGERALRYFASGWTEMKKKNAWDDINVSGSFDELYVLRAAATAVTASKRPAIASNGHVTADLFEFRDAALHLFTQAKRAQRHRQVGKDIYTAAELRVVLEKAAVVADGIGDGEFAKDLRNLESAVRSDETQPDTFYTEAHKASLRNGGASAAAIDLGSLQEASGTPRIAEDSRARKFPAWLGLFLLFTFGLGVFFVYKWQNTRGDSTLEVVPLPVAATGAQAGSGATAPGSSSGSPPAPAELGLAPITESASPSQDWVALGEDDNINYDAATRLGIDCGVRPVLTARGTWGSPRDIECRDGWATLSVRDLDLREDTRPGTTYCVRVSSTSDGIPDASRAADRSADTIAFRYTRSPIGLSVHILAADASTLVECGLITMSSP